MRLYILIFVIAVNVAWVVVALVLHDMHLYLHIPTNVQSLEQPYISKENISIPFLGCEVYQNHLRLDLLLGLVAVGMALMLSIQTIGMVMHRLSVISYLVAKSNLKSNNNE